MENTGTLENTQGNAWDDIVAIEVAKKLEAEKLAKEEAEKKAKEDEEAAKKTPKKEKEKTKEMEIVTNVNWVQKTVKRSFLQKESTEQRRVGKREVTIEKTVFKTDEKGEIVLKDGKPVLVREAKKIYV